ncbi:tripartite tricarboxylate transporter substrate binding protein [Comamonas sp. BIGb0124]|uniref:Bug family tripartite tricarboxylate transporter substrate binding protein n=1 Tax=Comamonas sp. BIGb0124 TaxID=2485130 RepID=UPI0013154B17|nr:tripartite tricarboxylate transporter substrate binding protein [Comamonas sp. BIGb0124]
MNKANHRTLITVGKLIGFALALPVTYASAETPVYPNRVIQLIAQQPPGSQSEAISRVWADCASRELGQSIVTLNKPGANGVLATNFLKSQPADGYNIMTVGMSQMTITPYIYKQLPYSPQRDFDGITVLSTSPLLLVASVQSGIKQYSDIAAVAKKAAGGIDFGSPGKGSPAHLLTAGVAQQLTVESTHVPFVGEGAAVTALMGGQIQIMTVTSGTAAPLIKDGRMIPLAIYTEARDKAFPQVPTILELTGSKEMALPGWLALVAKAGTPSDVLKRLGDVTAKCVASEAYGTRMEAINAVPVKSSPSDVKLWTDRYTAVFKPMIERLDLAE